MSISCKRLSGIEPETPPWQGGLLPLHHRRGCLIYRGEGGIRTHGGFEASPVFKTGSINHSDTSPKVEAGAGFEPAAPLWGATR